MKNIQKIAKEVEIYLSELIKYFELNNFWKEDNFFQIIAPRELFK